MSASENRAGLVACFATQGPDSNDEDRIRRLLGDLSPVVLRFDRSKRARAALGLLRDIRALDPDVVVMEGTGVGGGLAAMASRILDRRPYVVSSGDAVAPFIAARNRPLGAVAGVYERALYALSAGFIGWSPYLVGRALTYGVPRAMTAPHWADPNGTAGEPSSIRSDLGIPADAIVFGLVGSLNWSPRYAYCYGRELVLAASAAARDDVHVLIVGDGDGRAQLERDAGDHLGRRIHLTGRVPRTAISDYLRAIDVASLPQSVDGVGSFRYTTKVSEYRDAALPIVTGQIPLAYDLDDGSLWRLPGDAPWDELYVESLARLMSTVTREELASRRPQNADDLFSFERQRAQAAAFVKDVLARHRRRHDDAVGD